MAEVTLVIKADNSQYINKMKEAQQASQKLHDTSVAGEKREKGILEEIDATLARLEKSKRRAFTFEDIEKYNKKITEAKQHLQEYENAGKEVTKGTETMIQSIGKWAVGLGIAAKALDMLKTAFKDTIAGMYAFNAAGAAMKQVLYNIVNGVGDWNQGVAQSIILAKQRTDLLLKDRMEMIKSKELMREYNKLYTESIENMDDGATKIAALTKAKEKYQQAIKIEINSTKEQLALALDALKIAPQSTSAQQTVVDLYGKLQDLLGSQESGIRRISRQIATEQEKLFTDALTAVHNFQKEIQDTIDDINKEETEAAVKSLKDLDDEALKGQKRATELHKWKEGEEDKRRKKRAEDSDKEVTYWEILQELTENSLENIGNAIDESEKRKKENADATREAELESIRTQEEAKFNLLQSSFMNIESLTNSSSQIVFGVLNNRLNRELAKIDEYTKIKLEFAKNDVAEQMRITEEAEQKKLKLQEEYTEKARKLEIASIAVSKAIAIAEIIIQTAIANAKAVAASPLTAGMPWVAINNTQAALSIAAVVAAAAAAIIATGGKKFAKGGWTGDGGDRDETGERVAGVVHEKEFVTKRGPASKYREVLEAINRDDKAAIHNSFTKIEPELLGNTTNNISVENSGPNNRLDRINNQLSQLNQNFTTKRVREEVMTDGSTTIIRKGSNVRTVKR